MPEAYDPEVPPWMLNRGSLGSLPVGGGQDFGMGNYRPQLTTIPGARSPWGGGGTPQGPQDFGDGSGGGQGGLAQLLQSMFAGNQQGNGQNALAAFFPSLFGGQQQPSYGGGSGAPPWGGGGGGWNGGGGGMRHRHGGGRPPWGGVGSVSNLPAGPAPTPSTGGQGTRTCKDGTMAFGGEMCPEEKPAGGCPPGMTQTPSGGCTKATTQSAPAGPAPDQNPQPRPDYQDYA